MEEKKIFSILDLKSGFHHVNINEESIKYTAFVTPNGQYEYQRMPFGLKNDLSVFQRFINNIFRDLIYKRLIVIYMDDLLIATDDFKEHRELLRSVLTRITNRALQLNLEKCKFGSESIDYLGYAVSSAGIRLHDAHIAAYKCQSCPFLFRTIFVLQKICAAVFSYR